MNNLTLNFETFGCRELYIAGELLQAYANNPVIEKDGLMVGFNQNSGDVFLYNETGEFAMLDGDKILITLTH